MREWPLRLAPGVDLKRAVEGFAADHLPHGGFVVCGIGSLVHPRLRLAAADEATRYSGPYEILTLCGTVTARGAHLHMSIASAAGAVVGGHVVEGNEVRTTVELLLAEAPDWRLDRGPDPATGFLELLIRPQEEKPT